MGEETDHHGAPFDRLRASYRVHRDILRFILRVPQFGICELCGVILRQARKISHFWDLTQKDKSDNICYN